MIRFSEGITSITASPDFFWSSEYSRAHSRRSPRTYWPVRMERRGQGGRFLTIIHLSSLSLTPPWSKK